MKTLLAVLCGLVALFAGACAVYLLGLQVTDSGAAMLALIPGTVAVLNLLVLLALLGRSRPRRWAFYVLAAVDVLAALAMAMFWSSISFKSSRPMLEMCITGASTPWPDERRR